LERESSAETTSKDILLGFVETMNLVDEDQGPAPCAPKTLSVRHHGFDFFDPTQHGAERYELAPRHARDQACQRGFSRAGWSPQNHRLKLIAFDLHPQRFARSENVLLAHEVLEALGTHALG
jgi:hypothetical protein